MEPAAPQLYARIFNHQYGDTPERCRERRRRRIEIMRKHKSTTSVDNTTIMAPMDSIVDSALSCSDFRHSGESKLGFPLSAGDIPWMVYTPKKTEEEVNVVSVEISDGKQLPISPILLLVPNPAVVDSVKLSTDLPNRVAMLSKTEMLGVAGESLMLSAKRIMFRQLTAELSPSSRWSMQDLLENPMPVYGSISIQGSSHNKDDALLVKEDFCRPDKSGGQPLHFFALYDGCKVSASWKTMMPTIIAEELRRIWSKRGAAATTLSGDIGSKSIGGSSTGSNSTRRRNKLRESLPGEEWDYRVRLVLDRSFRRINRMDGMMCRCWETNCICSCRSLGFKFNPAGSTAIVTILTSRRIVVANCGDSHAVLCRGGRAIPLTVDHKRETAGELERIHAAGGKICCGNGVRVYGVLNMSRSIGESLLESVERSEPEVSILEREAEDEFLILASYAVWKVIPHDLACRIVSASLTPTCTAAASHLASSSMEDDGASHKYFQSRSAFAAAILGRLAFARGANNTITVLVIDFWTS